MSKAVSLKLQDSIFRDTEEIIKKIHEPRNSYINKALAYYNRCMRRNLLKSQLVKESAAVYQESLEINHEFEKLDDEIPGL